MEILKQASYRDYDIMIVRKEHQKVEIILDEQSTVGQSSMAWAKKADNTQGAKYEAKNVSINTKTGDNINIGIAITRSR